MKMNTIKLMGLAMSAGLASCASANTASTCPPEEGSPGPANVLVARTTEMLPASSAGKQVVVKRNVLATAPGVTYSTQGYPLTLAGQGSSREGRVYRNGEKLALTGVRVLKDDLQRRIRIKQDGQDVLIEQRDGKVTARVNGQQVPADRVTIKDGKVEVRDADGKTILTEEWGDEIVVRGVPVPPAPPVPPIAALPGVTFIDPAAETPKVMLGVTMDDADPELVEHLGLPMGDYALIESVPTGLPASKAGILPKDVIVSFDGQTPACADVIREVVKGKQPGDSVDVEVARKGQRVKMRVALEAFDNKRFPALRQSFMMPAEGQADKAWEDRIKEMNNLDEKTQEKINTAMEQARRSVGGVHLNDKVIGITRNGGNPLILSNPEGQVRLEERLTKLEEQLQRLEQLLRRLESPGGTAQPATTAPSSGGPGNPAPWCALGA